MKRQCVSKVTILLFVRHMRGWRSLSSSQQNPVAGIDCCSVDSYGPAGLCEGFLTRGAFLMCQLRPQAALAWAKLQKKEIWRFSFGWCGQFSTLRTARGLIPHIWNVVDGCKQHSFFGWYCLNCLVRLDVLAKEQLKRTWWRRLATGKALSPDSFSSLST